MMFNFGRHSMLRNNMDNSDIVKNSAKCGVVWHKVFLYSGPVNSAGVKLTNTRLVSSRLTILSCFSACRHAIWYLIAG